MHHTNAIAVQGLGGGRSQCTTQSRLLSHSRRCYDRTYGLSKARQKRKDLGASLWRTRYGECDEESWQ